MSTASALAAHDRISPTAKFVAYLRTFTDIPYSAEIAVACKAEETFKEMVGENPQNFLWIALTVEMRYKSLDAALERYRSKTIIELASGVSPRGLIRSKDDSCNFLETDLPEILAEKKSIVTDILGDQPRENLHWMLVDVMKKEHFLNIERFGEGPVTIINEGLLPYLSHAKKEKVARSIHRLLKKRGGVWITPDVYTSDRMKELMALDLHYLKVMRIISGRTGQNLQSNAFRSAEENEQFFTNLGFKLTKWNQCELVPRLTALNKVEIDPKKLEIVKERGKIWAMEAL